MLVTLNDLLAPVSRFEFLEAFRGRKRLHISGSDPTRAETLLSWHDIDTLLSGHGLDENVSIMRDSVLVPRQFYTSNEGRELKVRALNDLLAQGVSIIVNGVDRLIPQIGQLAAAVEREMGIQTRVNAYLSFRKGGAFQPHWDIHDVLAIQVHGNKRWRFWKVQVPDPIEMADALQINANVADQEIDFAPGDVLFIPRGEPHAAAVSVGCSVHLTIGLRSHTGIDFLNYLRRQGTKDLLLRMDLPRHSSNEQSDAHETALKHRLHQLIDAASVSQFLREDDLSRLPAVQTTVTDAPPQMADALRLTLRRRVPLPNVGPEGGAQSVTIGGEARSFFPATIDVLRWLFDHDHATLRELHAGLTPRYGHESIETAIGELLRHGLLVVNRAVE